MLVLDISDVEMKGAVFMQRAGNTQQKGDRHRELPSSALPARTLPLCMERAHKGTHKITLVGITRQCPHVGNDPAAPQGEILQTSSAELTHGRDQFWEQDVCPAQTFRGSVRDLVG